MRVDILVIKCFGQLNKQTNITYTYNTSALHGNINISMFVTENKSGIISIELLISRTYWARLVVLCFRFIMSLKPKSLWKLCGLTRAAAMALANVNLYVQFETLCETFLDSQNVFGFRWSRFIYITHKLYVEWENDRLAVTIWLCRHNLDMNFYRDNVLITTFLNQIVSFAMSFCEKLLNWSVSGHFIILAYVVVMWYL